MFPGSMTPYGNPPLSFSAAFSFEKFGSSKGLFAVVKQDIKGNFQGPLQFLQCFDGWDCVAILDPGGVAADYVEAATRPSKTRTKTFLRILFGEVAPRSS